MQYRLYMNILQRHFMQALCIRVFEEMMRATRAANYPVTKLLSFPGADPGLRSGGPAGF